MSLTVPRGWDCTRRGLVDLAVVMAVLGLVGAFRCVGSARAAETVYACGSTVNAVFVHAAKPNLGTSQVCPIHGGLTAGGLKITSGPAATTKGTAATWTAVAPSGLTIRHATATNMDIAEVNGSSPYGGGFFWGPNATDGATFYSGEPAADFGVSKGTVGFPTQDFGFQLVCGAASCPKSATASVGGVVLTVGETEGTRPSLSASGVWSQNRWIRGSWPLAVASDSPAGVCSLTASVSGQQVGSSSSRPNQTVWHQCASVPLETTVHTGAFANGAGSLSVAANDAAGGWNAASHTLYIDNSTPGVSLSTPNDPDLNVWVNHAVKVKAAASSGPSGLAAFNCAVDGRKAAHYRSPGLTVNGDGTHQVACDAAGGAVDPQGNHSLGVARENIKIDEAPPAIQFAAVDPSDPTALAVHTRDPESGVAGASITMQGPHAKTATPLPATISGSELISRFNDGGKNGNYTFTATACDNVGNCGSTQETLHFPVRLRSNGLVSFSKIQTPAKTVHRRVRVGYHFKIVHKRVRVGYHITKVHRHRHGRVVTKQVKVGGHFKRVKRRIKVGGHFKRVKIVVHANRRCGHRRVKTGHHRWREISVCRTMKLRVVSHRRVRYGHKAKLHGLLITAQGAPIANAPVDILTRPNDRGGVYRLAATATTDAYGRWATKIPGGPSRQIRAYYPGGPDLEPVTAHATVIVPAKIHLSIAPRVLPWSHFIRISGYLAGRYHPGRGVALRLQFRIPGHGWKSIQPLRTNRRGGFHFKWSFGPLRGVATYAFRMATTATETDYPYAAGASRAIRVTFGKRTPHHHHRRHKTRHHHKRHRR